jgi:hypothetical protein
MAPGLHMSALTWEELRARATPCLRCKWAGAIAGPLSAPAREYVAAAFRDRRIAEVILFIRHDTGDGLGEAKGLLQHLVKVTGQCHWCGGAIPVAELVDCPECRALNISL